MLPGLGNITLRVALCVTQFTNEKQKSFYAFWGVKIFENERQIKPFISVARLLSNLYMHGILA